jgi:hypothetical protein
MYLPPGEGNFCYEHGNALKTTIVQDLKQFKKALLDGSLAPVG